MLLATPLAIMGAIYTAYFMSPKIRRVVKPSIELMEALPTVILGFLAGIWLAPYVENNLPILVTGRCCFPLMILVAASSGRACRRARQRRAPAGRRRCWCRW
jgi:phosphate transport system permease protein